MDTLEFTCNGMEFVFQCEHHSWSFRGEADALGNAYCSRHILLLLWSNRWVEICIPLSLSLSHACTHTLYLTHTHTYILGRIVLTSCSYFWSFPYRSQHARRAKSTKKENLFLKGTWDVSLLYIQIPFFFWLGGWHPAAVLFTL